MKSQMCNGLDVDQLRETVGNIQHDPGLAKAKFRAVNHWINGGHSKITIRDFDGARQTIEHKQGFNFDADEPPLLLGEDEGANPVEYILTALVYHAAAKGIEIEEVESELEGDLDLRGFLGLDEMVSNGYQNIRVKFRIKADAPQETLDELVELAQKRSPTFDIVTNPVPVEVTAERMRERMH